MLSESEPSLIPDAERSEERRAPPSFLSLAFHTNFFPKLLWRRLRRRPERAGFMGAEMEVLIGAGVCLVAVAVGLPSLWPGALRNWFWGGVGILGIAGFLALLVWSGWSRRGVPLSYDDFHPGPFFFLSLLGLTAGLWLGASQHSPLWALAGAVVGACLGYVLGILGGLWIQALGPVGMLLGFVAYLGLIVLVGVDALLIVLSIMR